MELTNTLPDSQAETPRMENAAHHGFTRTSPTSSSVHQINNMT
jgi:hypothetical protein